MSLIKYMRIFLATTIVLLLLSSCSIVNENTPEIEQSDTSVTTILPEKETLQEPSDESSVPDIESIEPEEFEALKWYTPDFESFAIAELEKRFGVVTYLSLADITNDGIPEVFLGYYSGSKDYRVEYDVYSVLDCKPLQMERATAVGQNKSIVRLEEHVPLCIDDDVRYDLFRGYYFIDPQGQRYYLTCRFSQNMERIDYLFEKLWNEDGKWYLVATNVPRNNYSITDEFAPFITVTTTIYSDDIVGGIHKCVEEYQKKVDSNRWPDSDE